MTPKLAWTYERDECWGPDGEPLLSAALRSEQLLLRVRNSRTYGLEVVIAPGGHAAFDDGGGSPVFKVAFDEGPPSALAARVQDCGELAFVTDVRRTVAELNCTNRLRLHARPRLGGTWLQLDAGIDDLQLARLLEPASGIALAYRDEVRERRLAHQRAREAAARATRSVPSAPATRAAPAAAAPSAAEELIGAVAPLAAFAIGAKLGRRMFGPDRHD